MADVNVLIKNRNGAIWDNIYPQTKADLVITTTDKQFASQTEKDAWNAKQPIIGYVPEDSSKKGQANGYAGLDSGGKVPSAQLPSYVDDVLEFTNQAAFPATGESGIIYVAQDTNKTFRWGGTAYVEISASLALGTTSATAYRGDYGNAAYTHSQAAHAPSTAQKNSDITKGEIEAKLIGVITTHSHGASAPATHAATHITGGADVIPDAVAGSKSGLMSANDKTKLDGIAAGATNYVHPTTSGNIHIPSGGAIGKTLKWAADGTAKWADASVVSSTEPTTPTSNDLWFSVIV